MSILLQLNKLSKRYPTGRLALNRVELSVPQGQVLALIGPSGAGKSTLIRCINQLVPSSSGEVLLKGKAIQQLRGQALRQTRRRIAMIFQEYALIERLSVMENVLSGRLGYVGFWRSVLRKYPSADVQKAFELLKRVGLEGFHNQRADALSGGQRQRVGVARALMQQPELLLVDEPTASLDPKTSRQIMRLLCEVCREQGLSAIINIHDVDLALRYADRIVGLRQGELVFDGMPDAVDSQVLTTIYGEEDWEQSGESQAVSSNVDAAPLGERLSPAWV